MTNAFYIEVIRNLIGHDYGWKEVGKTSCIRRCTDGTYALSYGDNSQIRGSLEVCLSVLKDVEKGDWR